MSRLSHSLTKIRDALKNGPIALIDRSQVGGSDVATDSSSSSLASPGLRACWRWLGITVFVVSLPVFYGIAWKKAELHNSGMQPEKVDPAVFYHDQHAYLNSGIRMRNSGYEQVLPRHRMPGFSLLLSAIYTEDLAYHPDLENGDARRVSDAYFKRTKRFNILLTLVGVVAFYGLSRLFLPPLESHAVTWAYAWLLAVIRAPYVQPEVIFYVLFLISLVLLWQMLIRPRWWVALLAALVLAIAFILKSTVLPLIALFIACAGVRFVSNLWTGRKSGEAGTFLNAAKEMGIALLVPLGFALILLPYFSNTAKLYGSPLWDVHSRHYMWMENDDEKRFWRNAGISEWDFAPPEGKEPPSAKTYFATHEFADIAKRIKTGWQSNLSMIHREYAGLDRLLWRLGFLPVFLLALISLRRVYQSFQRQWISWLLIAGFFIGYSLLYCWYSAIGVGPRLFLALYLPGWFFSALAIHWLAEPFDLKVFRWRAPLRGVLFGVILIYVAIGGIGVLSHDLWIIEGGR